MDTRVEDTEIVDIELELSQLASSLHSTLNRYPSFSPTAVGMLHSPCHHDLLICKIPNINWSLYLQSSVATNTLTIDGL